jgi:hypothetical protein
VSDVDTFGTCKVGLKGHPEGRLYACHQCTRAERNELLAMLKRLVACRPDLMARMTVMREAEALVKRIEGA